MSIGAAANLAGEPFFKKDGQRAVDRCFWIALLIDRLPMSSQARVISDEPCAQISLLPARKRLIDQITRSIIYSEPPLVIGVHGDWGSGKTSFLHFMNYWLTSDNTTHLDFKDPRPSNIPKNLVPVWFEAWRYQQESAPIVALLHEMRSKFTLWTRSQAEMKKLGEVAIRGALVALEDITKKIGIQASKIQEAGDAYEKERLSNTLPSAQLREFLDDALSKLLGSDKANNPRRLIVFIDDLDRCEPDTAYRLLEGLKIYLNLRRCIFVLGINQREVERALAKVMPSGTPGQGLTLAP